MKVVLCNVPMRKEQDRREYGIAPNLAINSILSYARKHGFDCEYYNMDLLLPSDKQIRKYFYSRKPDVVGISAVLSPCYAMVKHLVGLIRAASPGSFIVLGGNLAVLSGLCLERIGVDAVVVGEGEKAFVSLLRDMKPGVIMGESLPGDEYPLPDYRLLSDGDPMVESLYFVGTHRLNMFEHDLRIREHNGLVALMNTSKGCIGACSFCQRFCKGYKTMNLEQINEHLRMLHEKGIRLLYINDECFGSDRRHTSLLLSLLKRYGMFWAAGVRVEGCTRDVLQKYYDAGCVNLKYGIESGSQRILTVLNKGSTVEHNLQVLKDCFDIGIFSPPSLLLGMPGETDETVKESGRFLGEFCKYVGVSPLDVGCAFYFASPYPGTPLYDYGVRQGCLGGCVDEEERFLLFMDGRTLDKRNFVNLTGESTKKVFFWDYLCMLEALRTYYKGPIRHPGKSMPWTSGVSTEDSFKRFFRRFPMWFNRLLFRIPRWLLYPVARELLFLLNMRRLSLFRLNRVPERLTVVKPLKDIVKEGCVC